MFLTNIDGVLYVVEEIRYRLEKYMHEREDEKKKKKMYMKWEVVWEYLYILNYMMVECEKEQKNTLQSETSLTALCIAFRYTKCFSGIEEV